jgi:Di-haem oxidoreductase, putative peroxidase
MFLRRMVPLSALIGVVSTASGLVFAGMLSPASSVSSEDLLHPAPRQPIGDYDYFGNSLNPEQAAQIVSEKGLDPLNATSYQEIGAVQITPQLIEKGQQIFLNRGIGDSATGRVLSGLGAGLGPELADAIQKLQGQPTTNLQIILLKDLTLGSRTFAKGSTISTGLDVEKGASIPLGLSGFTCAACHVTLDAKGNRIEGAPNTDLNLGFLIALLPNSSGAFARLNINPLDPKYQGNGKQIMDSKGQLVTLPDPQKLENAFDDALLDLPSGSFESSPDGINDTTKIPNIFTFKSGPYTAGGEFAVGPFAGLSSISSAVHSSEVNLLAAAQQSGPTLGIDSEVYLGVALQNADPSLRLPEGSPIKPSEWLRKVAPDPLQAELQFQTPGPGTGNYPELKPNLFTYNGLIFSPDTNSDDIAAGPFLFAANAMAAYQNNLVPPPNQSPANKKALASGSVQRGAQVFQKANCASCHVAPFFTDNRIHPLAEINSNPARAQSRLGLKDLLVSPSLYSFNTPVPVPPDATVLSVPTEGISETPTSLPIGLLPQGGYKTTALRGTYLAAPYLHDGGVAVREGSLKFNPNGSFSVVDASGLGLPGTLRQGKSADSASSLRALVDRELREKVIQANKSDQGLVRSNLDGTGHDFYVDPAAGFSYKEQKDLVNFMLALDDEPGQF